MELTQFTVQIKESDKLKFEKATPQSVNINGVVFIREDVVQNILRKKFKNSEN